MEFPTDDHSPLPFLSEVERGLLGRPGSRHALPTPALVLDLDAFDRNLLAMAAHCRDHGLALRPHAKTHKCADIALAQRRAGAVGVCVAKPSEAAALRAAGVDDLLLTSPLADPRKVGAFLDLAPEAAGLAAVVDHEDGLRVFEEAAGRRGIVARLLVDLDVGTCRTGAPPDERALELVRRIDASPSLGFGGFQAYAGHVMHVAGRAERRAASGEALARVAALCRAVEEAGIEVPVVSGGGTGTFDLDPDLEILTELQAGSYIFMDREYADVFRTDGEPAFETSLFVHATVISANQSGFVTTDAGFKAFATDGPRPVFADREGAKYFFLGDEHGGVAVAEGGRLPARGEVLVLTAPHCDPTVNLYDRYACVRGDRLVGFWRVHGRGCLA
jgi:3-hydroxy-D-aspartate aldolase